MSHNQKQIKIMLGITREEKIEMTFKVRQAILTLQSQLEQGDEEFTMEELAKMRTEIMTLTMILGGLETLRS